MLCAAAPSAHTLLCHRRIGTKTVWNTALPTRCSATGGSAIPSSRSRVRWRSRCAWRMHVASYLVHTLPFAADIWCDTVEWQEYHEFLGMLYSYIARRGKLIQMEGAWVCSA